MTKTIFSTNIAEIKTVKIICSCGAKFDIPIEARTPPETCFACGKKLDWQPINRFIKGLSELKQAVLDGKYDACIETEEIKK